MTEQYSVVRYVVYCIKLSKFVLNIQHRSSCHCFELPNSHKFLQYKFMITSFENSIAVLSGTPVLVISSELAKKEVGESAPT